MTKDIVPTKLASISIKTIGYSAKEIRHLVEGTKQAHFLARVGGVVIESFTGVSKTGDWVGFKGIFSLVNRDGLAFQSSVVFLPANIEKRIVEQLALGLVEVEFMADIYAQESDKNAGGYAYMCEPCVSDEAAKKAAAITSRVLTSKLPVTLALTDQSATVKSKKSA